MLAEGRGEGGREGAPSSLSPTVWAGVTNDHVTMAQAEEGGGKEERSLCVYTVERAVATAAAAAAAADVATPPMASLSWNEMP